VAFGGRSSVLITRCSVGLYRRHRLVLLPLLFPSEQARLDACAAALLAAHHSPAALSEHRTEVQASAERFQEMVKQLTKAPPEGSTNNHPAVAALQMVWPSLDTCLSAYAASENMVEKLCRCYKLVIRAAGVHFAPSLQIMATHLVEHFKQSPQPAYLYTASILITELGSSAPEPLLQMLTSMSEAAFARLQSLEAFTAQPDMVEEYFFLVSRFLEYCPSLLLTSPLIAQVVQCGMVGLQIDHRAAHAGVSSCLYHLICAGTKPLKSAPRGSAPLPEHTAAVIELLRSVGGVMVGGIISGLASERPVYGLEKEKSNPAAVLWQIAHLQPNGPQILSQLLGNALTAVPTAVFSEEERGAWTGQLGTAITARNEGGFFDAIRDFNSACRRKHRAIARTQERALN